MQQEIELIINGDTVESPWWSSEMSEYMCLLCGKECDKNELQVRVCLNANPFCG